MDLIVKNDNNKDSLCSLNCELHSLAGLMQHPDTLFLIEEIINSDSFFDKSNGILFSVLKSEIENSRTPDKVSISEQLKSFGVSYFGEIPIFDFLTSLTFIKTTKAATIENFKILAKLKILRSLDTDCIEIRKLLRQTKGAELNSIIAQVDEKHSKRIQLLQSKSSEFDDICDQAKNIIEEIAKNPQIEAGLITEFPLFNKFYGGIRKGEGVYAITSPAKAGKSSWLLEMSKGLLKMNEGLKILYLDTELSKNNNIFRLVASETGVPCYSYEKGSWITNENYKKKYRENIDKITSLKGRLYHYRIPNKPMSDVCFLVKKWYYKYVGRGNQACIILDYFKPGGEKVTANWAEHQILGEKINMFNDLLATLGIFGWSAIQTNRNAATGAVDETIVSITSRLQWYCAFNGYLKRKTLEEISDVGVEWGSHAMYCLATRFQGDGSVGHFDFINVSTDPKKKKYAQNYINYNIDNFSVEERGSLNDIVAAKQEKYSLDQ